MVFSVVDVRDAQDLGSLTKPGLVMLPVNAHVGPREDIGEVERLIDPISRVCRQNFVEVNVLFNKAVNGTRTHFVGQAFWIHLHVTGRRVVGTEFGVGERELSHA